MGFLKDFFTLKVKLEVVPFYPSDGTELQATKLGDIYAFNCPCGKHPPLVTNATCWVECPSCKRRYKIMPFRDKDSAYVQEIR